MDRGPRGSRAPPWDRAWPGPGARQCSRGSDSPQVAERAERASGASEAGVLGTAKEVLGLQDFLGFKDFVLFGFDFDLDLAGFDFDVIWIWI